MPPTKQHPLAVSYGGKNDGLRIGGLFRITGMLGGFYEVQLADLHPSHPFAHKPIASWVEGIHESNGRLLMKSSMVRQNVKSVEEYRQIFEGIFRSRQDRQKIIRLSGMLRHRFTRSLCQISKSLKYSPLQSKYVFDKLVGAEGERFLVMPSNGIKRWSQFLEFNFSPSEHEKIYREFGHLLCGVVGQLGCIGVGMEVTLLDQKSMEVAPAWPPSMQELSRYFKKIGVMEGRYFLTRAGTQLVRLCGLSQVYPAYKSEAFLSCYENYLLSAKSMTELVRGIEESGRSLGRLRIDLEQIRRLNGGE